MALDPALAKYLTAAPNYAGIAKQAGIQARASLAPTLAELERRKAQSRSEAALEAQQINQATLAGVNVLGRLNLPGQVAQSYRDAAANQLGAAQSYSGDLRNTMTADAEAVNRNLQALGAPGQALNQGQAAGNVLLGLGSAPATTWSQSAPSAVLAAGQVPLTLAQTGQQGQLAAFAGGRQEAAKVQQSITDALLKLPGIRSDLVAQLTAAADKRHQSGISNYMDAVRLDQADTRLNAPKTTTFGTGGVLRTNADGSVEILRQPDEKPHGTRIVSDPSGQYLVDSVTGGTIAKVGDAKPAAGANGTTYQDAFGREVRVSPDGTQTVLSPGKFTDPATGRLMQVGTDGKITPLTKPKKKDSDRPLTAEQVKSATGSLLPALMIMRNGGKDKDGNPLASLSRADALAEIKKQGYLSSPQYKRLALALLNRIYGAYEQGIAAGTLYGPPIPSGAHPGG